MKLAQQGDLPKNEIRKRVLTRLVASPLVVGPVMLGFTAIVAGWAMDLKQMALCLFGGLAGMMVGAGAFFTKWMVSGQQVAQDVLTEWEKEQSQSHIRDLDQLEADLTEADEDPRPEEALKDLRALVATFGTLEKQPQNAAWPMIMEVRMQVEALFEHCVRLIRQSHALWETASRLNTASAKDPIMAQREGLIEEVQTCVSQLSQTMVSLQNIHQVESNSERLKQMRNNLDESLEVARKVESRMRQWPATAHHDSKTE